MAKIVRKASRAKKVGLPPGTLLHIGEKRAEKVKITVVNYSETGFEEREAKSVEECFVFKDKPSVTWINVDGLHELEIIEKIGSHFNLHPLILEDIVTTEQRPKFEDLGHYVYIVLKMLYLEKWNKHFTAEQVSLVLGSNFLISFQEKPGDVFDVIRERIRTGKGKITKMGSDDLAYSLMDAIVDHYFVVLEKLGEDVDFLEEQLLSSPGGQTLPVIHGLKRGLIFLRRSVWPLREVISGLERGESPLVEKSTRLYLRDVYDHTIQVMDTVEALRDTVSGMIEIYLSSLSNKLNEIMKMLTLIATIFIPLTFIVGIYGMNFLHMPEIKWRYGYAFVWGVMIAVALAMLIYFRKKKWL